MLPGARRLKGEQQRRLARHLQHIPQVALEEEGVRHNRMVREEARVAHRRPQQDGAGLVQQCSGFSSVTRRLAKNKNEIHTHRFRSNAIMQVRARARRATAPVTQAHK